jgi:hypothetical protein
MSECETAPRGLHNKELASLTGFTSRASRAVAHLREAWLSADNDNAAAIERALYELFRGHSFQRNKELMLNVLTAGLDESQAAAITRRIKYLHEATNPKGTP